jgi:hypothetical protein
MSLMSIEKYNNNNNNDSNIIYFDFITTLILNTHEKFFLLRNEDIYVDPVYIYNFDKLLSDELSDELIEEKNDILNELSDESIEEKSNNLFDKVKIKFKSKSECKKLLQYYCKECKKKYETLDGVRKHSRKYHKHHKNIDYRRGKTHLFAVPIVQAKLV